MEHTNAIHYSEKDCPKRGYEKRKDAKLVLKKMKGNGKAKKGHVYLCKECGKWHITSMTRKNAEQVEDKIRRGFIARETNQGH